ncbi:type III secretion system cytoplasmic ring protein SctQ [Corallococcus carmarthensis]|uniref:Flagellar motor switch protein FliM n=1 Tax=Corallococcus carmarthensis TaxID=2316728 RepID=A0A3A8JLS0_9BACT|nr:type III secretion system cytoplasmic ring protein SctQ [Corallococcus carmarthensis]NOK20342.1 type III secretion system cytoplasmic ring protein SctQ [Corallococcus carmarthensis]RKG95948.1 YscQ/HrcQ family type III secretion apparatus protein [Corallococcus carmarthensis]
MSLEPDDEPGVFERTMLVDTRKLGPPPKPAAAPARAPEPVVPWRPFAFTNLEKVSRSQGQLAERLRWLTPNAGTLETVCARLKALFDVDVRLSVESAQARPMTELRRFLGDPSFLAVLAPGALKGRAILEIELSLAHSAVDLLLGGAGETVGLRPLTDIEEGVMGYVVLEALKELVPGLQPGVPRPRLDGVARGVDEVSARLGEDGPMLAVHLNAVLGSHRGIVRLVVPSAVLEAAEPAVESAQRRDHRRQDMKANGRRLSSLRDWLRAEIGVAELSAQDLASLRIKDVLLLDLLLARPDKGEAGTAQLRLGLGRTGHFAADVFVENGRYRARITDIIPGEPGNPQGGESGGSAENEDFTNPELGVPPELEGAALDDKDGSDLLSDLPLQVAVELARVPISAEQVVGLRTGQVIDLRRGAGEPVDLSVNGKVVARGELVELEGQLGVRIIHLS